MRRISDVFSPLFLRSSDDAAATFQSAVTPAQLRKSVTVVRTIQGAVVREFLLMWYSTTAAVVQTQFNRIPEK